MEWAIRNGIIKQVNESHIKSVKYFSNTIKNIEDTKFVNNVKKTSYVENPRSKTKETYKRNYKAHEKGKYKLLLEQCFQDVICQLYIHTCIN